MNWTAASIRNTGLYGSSMPINNSDYEQFCHYLMKTCGITLGENKLYLVQSRLKPIMENYKLFSLGELVRMLAEGGHAGLEKHVIDAMTTNETSWFRDEYPFMFLNDVIFTAVPMTQTKPLRIWSAACSYGHEAYSISMIVQEFLLRNPGRLPGGIEIIGTDISSKALEQAMSGLYSPFETERGLSEERRKKHFSNTGQGFQVTGDVKKRVSFRKHNLITNAYPLGMFDVIFCRNVLIYFSNKHKAQILDNMVRCLVPGGYLFLGASEPMSNYSNRFEMVPFSRGVIYRLKNVRGEV